MRRIIHGINELPSSGGQCVYFGVDGYIAGRGDHQRLMFHVTASEGSSFPDHRSVFGQLSYTVSGIRGHHCDVGTGVEKRLDLSLGDSPRPNYSDAAARKLQVNRIHGYF